MDSKNEKYNNYLDKFPTGFRDYLRIEKNKKAFLDKVEWDYAPLKVYRMVHCCKSVFKIDFLNNIEEDMIFPPNCKRPVSLDRYAVSVNESLDMIKKSFKLPFKKKHLMAIAVGEMNCKYGPADFDDDRPHHNWYLYQDSDLELIERFSIFNGD